MVFDRILFYAFSSFGINFCEGFVSDVLGVILEKVDSVADVDVEAGTGVSAKVTLPI